MNKISPRIARWLGALALCSLFACAPESSRAAESDWKVGMARVKITPPYPVWMSGYASRDKPFQSVDNY